MALHILTGLLVLVVIYLFYAVIHPGTFLTVRNRNRLA